MRPPILTAPFLGPPTDYKPSTSNLQPLLPYMLPRKIVRVVPFTSTESFVEEMLECDDNVSVTSSCEFNDYASVSVASDAFLPLMRVTSDKWAEKTHKDLPNSIDDRCWREAASPNEMLSHKKPWGLDTKMRATGKAEVNKGPAKVDGKVLYEDWWSRVRPASGEKAGAAEVQSSVAPASDRGILNDTSRAQLENPLIPAPSPAPSELREPSSSDALRHHDFTLFRAAGTRRGMRKDTSNRAKLESPILAGTESPGAPSPAPGALLNPVILHGAVSPALLAPLRDPRPGVASSAEQGEETRAAFGMPRFDAFSSLEAWWASVSAGVRPATFPTEPSTVRRPGSFLVAF
ncbi:hypothetical protein T484DRAFT_1824100 [Baffinella frigidus]|nr:hypothetical protein T484DRAFT_1824100 [Cryptophyta sp. CCMP2293]